MLGVAKQTRDMLAAEKHTLLSVIDHNAPKRYAHDANKDLMTTLLKMEVNHGASR